MTLSEDSILPKSCSLSFVNFMVLTCFLSTVSFDLSNKTSFRLFFLIPKIQEKQIFKKKILGIVKQI